MRWNKKIENFVTWGFRILTGLIFLSSSLTKLLFEEGDKTDLLYTKYNLHDHILLIGAAEFIALVLFFIPKTFMLGVLLLTAITGGAIITHIANNEPFYFAAIILLFIWLTAYLKLPGLFPFLKTKKKKQL